MASENAKMVEDILGDWGWADTEINVVEEQDTGLYVIGLDPGGTTGVAILRVDTEDPKALPELVYLDQVEDGRDGFLEYFGQFYIGTNSVVASEHWVERNVKGVNREPQYIEGVMHALWNRHTITWQDPEMKSLVPDEWLKENNLWTEGKRHQMDALIHAIVYLRNDGHEGTQRALGNEESDQWEEGTGEGAQGDGQPMDEDARRELAEMAREAADKRMAAKVKEESDDDREGTDKEGNGTVEPKGKRKERDLDGAFIGYVSAEDEEGLEEVSLLDD